MEALLKVGIEGVSASFGTSNINIEHKREYILPLVELRR